MVYDKNLNSQETKLRHLLNEQDVKTDMALIYAIFKHNTLKTGYDINLENCYNLLLTFWLFVRNLIYKVLDTGEIS